MSFYYLWKFLSRHTKFYIKRDNFQRILFSEFKIGHSGLQAVEGKEINNTREYNKPNHSSINYIFMESSYKTEKKKKNC